MPLAEVGELWGEVAPVTENPVHEQQRRTVHSALLIGKPHPVSVQIRHTSDSHTQPPNARSQVPPGASGQMFRASGQMFRASGQVPGRDGPFGPNNWPLDRKS